MAVKFDSIGIEAAVIGVGEDVDIPKGLSAFDDDFGFGHWPAGVAALCLRRGEGDGKEGGKRRKTEAKKGYSSARSAGVRRYVEVCQDVTHSRDLYGNRSDIFWPLGEVRS